jgi:hypothetical protein
MQKEMVNVRVRLREFLLLIDRVTRVSPILQEPIPWIEADMLIIVP